MLVFGTSPDLDTIVFLSKLHEICHTWRGVNYTWKVDGFYKTVYDLLLSGF